MIFLAWAGLALLVLFSLTISKTDRTDLNILIYLSQTLH